MGKLRQGQGGGPGEPRAAWSQHCHHQGLGTIPDTPIRSWASCQSWARCWGHGDTGQAAWSRGPLGETEARGWGGGGSRQGLLQAAAGRAHDLAQGAEGLAQEVLPEPPCHQELSPGSVPIPLVPGTVGGAVPVPPLTCLERSGLLESTSYLGTEQGTRG